MSTTSKTMSPSLNPSNLPIPGCNCGNVQFCQPKIEILAVQ